MLIKSWKENKKDIEGKRIDQLVTIAGGGKLRDGSDCSKEIRDFLSLVDIEVLQKYIKQCLEKSFADSGLVLQDLLTPLVGNSGEKSHSQGHTLSLPLQSKVPYRE